MTCSRDTLIQLRANLLAKGYTESQVDMTLKLILEKSKNETFRTAVESKTITVISEEEKAFLRSTYTKLQDRIASITKADEPLNKSFKELVSSLLHADDRIKFFQILNKLKIADGDFSSLDTSYLNNLENIITISRNKNRKTQVLRLEERLEKERERLLRRQEQEKESQSVKDKLREEIENVQQLLTFISSVLDGSVSSESTDVINKIVDFNKQIADVKLGVGLRLAELASLKEKLKKIKVTGTEKEKNALKAKITELDESIKVLRKKSKDLDKQRANFIKEQIKKGLLTPKEELKEYESLSSLKIQIAKRVDSLKEKLANETLKTFQQSSRQIAKSLEEKLVRERTASISIQNAYRQRVRILNAYIEQRQDAFPDEPVIVDIGFLMHLVGNNAFERYLKENRLVENKNKSTTIDRSDFTEDEAKKLIEATSNYSYSALSQGFFSEDIATATDAQLAYLEAVAMGKQVVDLTETNVNNIPVAPNNPNFLERSNPGVIPIQNKAKTAKELASWLEFTLRGLHSLKASKFNNGYISSVALDMVLHPRLYDMVSTIAFKDAIAPRSDKRIYSSSDRFAQLFAIKEMLKKAGILDPDKLPEFNSDFYGKDPKNDTLVTLDIETEGTEDGTLTGIYSIQLTTYNMGDRKTVVLVNRNIDGVNTLVDNKTPGLTGKITPLTPEQIKTVLDQVETLQNGGYKLITYNGNGFDLSNLNLFGGDPKQLLRVTSRSIDLLENIRFDTGRQRVAGSKLKVVGENNLPTYERLGYDGRIRFTNGYVQEKLPDGSWNNVEINQAKMNEMVKQANETGDWTVFNAYAENDTELTLDLYFHLMSNDKTNLKLVYKGTTEFVTLSKPRSNLFLSLSEVNPGSRTFKESMPSILAMNPEIDSIANQMGYAESTQINLDSVIDTIQGWLLEVWATDPNNKATLDILTEGLQEESSVKNKLHALAILKANKFGNAIKPLAKQYFKKYNYVDRLNFIEDPDTGRLILNPSIYTTNWETINVEEDSDQLFVPIEGLTEEIKADLYEKQVIIYFLENLENSQTLKKIIQLLPERFGVRKMLQNEQFADYFMEVLPEVLSQYTKINRIADFGNGNVDWHTAYDVGNAIADVLNNKQEGVTLIDNFVLQGGNVDNVSELNGTFAAWQGRQKNFIIPDKTRINFASPFGIAHEALVYDNFRLVTRINWILNQEWTNTELEEILDWAQKPQDLNPDEVISFFAKAAKPTVFPEVRSRSAFDLVPDLDERKRIGMEFIYGMPRLLSIFNHDCAYRGIRFPNKFLGKEAPVYYTSEWMSAGAPTAAAISAGAIDQIAWMLTFDMDSPESEAELMRSVEAAVTLLRSNPDLIESTNKSDYSYHGLHIMLAALKFYTPAGWSDYLELLKDLQVAEIDESGELIVTEEVLKKQLDPRFKAIDLVVEELGKIKNGTSIENTKYALNASEIQLLEEIATFFDKDRAAGKEFLKGAVTPRFYQAGAKGIFNGLLKKIEDSNLPLNANHARVLTKVLLRENMNTHMTLIDQAIGLSKVDTKQVQQVFRKFSKTMSSANFQAELGLMQQQNWYGEMDWRKRAEGIRNYFNRYISLLADKLVTTRLSKTEREKAIQAKEEELRNLYKDRIWKATHAFGNVDFSLMSMEEKIKHQEKIGIILSGGKKGYERHLVLWALNKRAATPTKLLDDQIELHRRITGTHIDSDDYEGWLNRVIFHTYGLEAASGRNHMYGGYGYGPESSKLGQVRVEEGDEKNLLGIWDIDDSNVIEEDYNRAFGTQLLLDLAPYYRPPVGYNSLDERESVYFETMERRSVLERQASREAELLGSLNKDRTIGSLTVKDILEKQAKVSGRPIERMRYRRLASNLIDETNLINLDSSVDGIGATRPMLADLDFTQRGIYSLIRMQNQINIENSREGRLLKKIQEAKDRNEPLDINSIIPLESRGYEKPTTRDALPMIPLQTGNTLASMITGPTSEIEQIAIRKKNQLTVFAKLNGLDSLLEDKRWDLLYFISEGRRRALKPAMEILSGSTKNQQQSYFTAKTAFFDGLFKLVGLTARQYNPDKTYSAIEIQAETGEINFTREFIEDLKSKNPEGLSYLALLYHLSHVYRRLEGIKLGLVQDPGIRVAGPEGLIKSPTRSLPLSDFNFEVSNMYMNILTSDVMARVATDYLKASHPELYNTIAKDQNGFVIVEALPLTDVKMHQIITKVTREKAAELVQEWTKNNLILGTAYSDISMLPRETVSEQTGPLVIENKRIGTTHTFTSLNNPDTLWAFTEEMVVQLLNNLSNNPLFTAFELAFQSGKQIGSGNTVTDQLIQEEQRNLFNYMGQFIEDEHAAIVWLHMMDPSPSRGETLLTINNYKIKDKFGNPTQLLDAPNYIRKTFNLNVDEFFSAPISIESLIYTTDIMKSIKRGDRIGLTREVDKLKDFLKVNLVEAEIKPDITTEKLVTVGSDILLRTVSVLYNLGTDATKITRQQIMNYVQPGLTTESQTKLFQRALEIVKIMQRIDNTNMEENQIYYYVASGLMDKLGEFNADLKQDQGFLSTVIDSVGVSLTQKERTKAIRSIQNAVDDYISEPGHIVNIMPGFNPRTDIAQFADPDRFIEAFGDTGRGIVDFLNGQVTSGNMSERTRDLKLILIGSLAMQNPNILKDLQLEAVELEGSSYAKAAKYNNKYTIGLNISAMRVTPENEILFKFAEELVHIARIKYLKDNSVEFETLKGIYRSENARGMIREMLMAMNMGKPYNALEQDVEYAMSHEEEFLSHFGAAILLQETIYNPTVLNELEAKYEAVHKLSNWWKRAFHRIKLFAKHSLKMMSQLRTNPYYSSNFELAYKAIQGIIGNGLRDKVDVANPNMEFNARKIITTTTKNLDPGSKQRVKDASQKLITIQGMLKDTTLTLTPEQIIALETEQNLLKSQLANPEFNPQSVMGISESQVQRGLAALRRDTFGRIINRRQVDFSTRALIAEGLNNYFKKRGNRVDNKDTIGGLIRIWEGDRQFIDNYLLYALEGFNQNGLTYNSPEALAVMISDMLDDTTVNTQSSYRSNKNTGTFVYNKELLKSYFADFILHSTLVSSEFANPDERQQIMVDLARKVLGLPLFSTDPKFLKAIDTLYKPFKVWQDRLRSEIFKAKIKENIDYLDPIGVKHKISRDISREQEDIGFRAIVNLMRTKYLKQLDENKLGSVINPYILFMGGLLPDPSINISQQTSFKDIFVKFTKAPDAVAANAKEAMIKHLVKVALDKKLKEDQQTDPTRTLATVRSYVANNPGNLHAAISETIEDLIYRTRENDTSFTSELVTLSNAEIAMIFDIYVDTVNITDESEHTGNQLRIMRGLEAFGFYQGQSKYLPTNSSVATPMDSFAFEYLGRLGASAYLFDTRTPMLTYQDLFLSDISFDPDDLATARLLFEEDIPSIQHSLLKGIGYDSVQRIVVQDMLGIPGAFFTIGQIIDMVQGLNNQEIKGSEDKRIDNLDGHKDDARRHTIERSLERLRLANDEARETLGFRKTGHGLVDTVVRLGRPATLWAYGSNIPLATALVEGGMGAIGSTLRGQNPVSFLWDAVVQNTVMATRALGDVVTVENGRLKFFDVSPNKISGIAENSLWLMEEMFSPMLSGRLIGNTFTNDVIEQLSAWERLELIWGRMQSSTMKAIRVSSETQARRRIVDMVRNKTLFKLRDSVNKILRGIDNPSNETLKLIIRDAEISMDQEILLTYIRSGLFEPDVLEVLEYILSVAPVFRNDLSIMEMRNQEYEVGKSGAFNYGKTTITADKISQARGTIIKLMKRHAELYMTAPHPLDGTANSAAMNIIMTFYKSYPTLFMSQFIMRRGSTTPALKFAFELMVYSMLDVMYNIFLALKSGYYRWEKIKRALAAQDINWTEVTKLILRFPVFSGNLVGLAGTLLGNLALDSRSKQTLFNSVAENAMGQTVTSFYKALESYVLFAMGEVGPSSPMWNTYRALSPALGGVGGSVVKMLLMQAFGDLNTSGRSSGNRSASSFVMDKIDSISHQNVRNQAVRAIFREAEYLPMERPEFRNVFGTKRWEKMAQALRNPPQEAVKPIEQQVENYEANTEWIDNYFPMPNVIKPRERSLEEQATNPIKPPDDLVD